MRPGKRKLWDSVLRFGHSGYGLRIETDVNHEKLRQTASSNLWTGVATVLQQFF